MQVDECYVSAEGVSASYRGIWRRHVALHSITFRARAGEITALVGPNGAGKTTLFRVLLGFLRADDGRCRVGGLEPADYRRRHGVAYVPEFPRFPRGWTGRDILGRSVDLAMGPDKRHDGFTRALERTGLDSRALSKPAVKCSNGTQRRLWLACALIGDPDVVVLDEPFAGLDPPARAELRRQMQSSRARGAAVLIGTHDLAEVARLADRIVAVKDGATTDTKILTPGNVVSGAGLERELFGEQ